MKNKLFKTLLLLFIFTSCVNKQKEQVNNRYYYKHVTKYKDENYLSFYSIQDVTVIKDSIFMNTAFFNVDLEVGGVYNDVYIKRGGELYSVRPNGTRLYFSTLTDTAVIYFADPDFGATNMIYGRIHWYLGTDSIKENNGEILIRHKFYVHGGMGWVEADLPFISKDKSTYLDGESMYYHYYDENFILLYTEYAGHLFMYREEERIHPSALFLAP